MVGEGEYVGRQGRHSGGTPRAASNFVARPPEGDTRLCAALRNPNLGGAEPQSQRIALRNSNLGGAAPQSERSGSVSTNKRHPN